MSDPTLDSNIDEISSWLDQLVGTYDFARAGAEGSLGQDLAGVVAEGIRERTVVEQLDSNRAALKPNERKYAARKARVFDAHQPLIRGGQMLSLESLIGDVEINGDEVTMHYGTGEEEPAKSSTGADMGHRVHKQIGAMAPPPTDREKAEWCTDGGRPFYALDDAIRMKVVEAAGASLSEHLRENA